MQVLNTNDILVLSSMRDTERNLGLCEARGMTRKMIAERSKLSMSTIIRSTKKLLEAELIAEAIKQINTKSYYVTEYGIQRLKDINKRG